MEGYCNASKPSYDALEEYIRRIDDQLPVPLSQKVNLEQYTRKIYEKAYICCEMNKDAIVSAVIGYVDNLMNNMSYISLVGTLPEGRRCGYAEKLMGQFLEVCADRHISGIHLYTDKTNAPAIRLYEKLGFVDDPNDDGARPESRHFVYWLGKENA